ncbi:peptidoglycan-binding domain-containing protein [Actinophytocola algeriensis]|uniref:Peptidoglycan hydrolase-like protein with peptidoglycan-binding domain n=1 Tax=Actinophytocola algeriensis TaxID=1768010 RepID=A0A7W7QEZ3_9PSEU|nr:peptidoglycan-binding protein [Actinophytocola algeriensis]MBB4912288.1 peptidoglycan hydrolase-like protein with peptidoglycan-binding domain [Actinophytocola algeriensis]MBE1474196.1 peptidoglycan hydrolase-like protein with peptidoglycan-binding domain [Actinophytocola algeriensis]
MTRPTLAEGDNDNSDVRLLQRMLRDLNYLTDPPDGDFGPVTAAALANFQEQHMVGDERGVCGVNTWAALAAQFGDLDGLRSEESIEEYVSDTYEDVVLSDKEPHEQLETVAAAANEQLAAAGVPYVPFRFGDAEGNWATFSWWDWEVTIDEVKFRAAGDENDPVYKPVYNMDTPYHEARHAEQWWLVARVLAGAYGMDGPSIHEKTWLPLTIANLAADDPVYEANAEATAALTWYEHKMGLVTVQSGVDPSNEADAAGAGGAVQRQVDENDWGGPAAGRHLLRLGHGNPGEIRYLQELLVYRGFQPGEPDSDFGPLTEEAVRAFQRSRGLTDDGIVGKLTWEALLP